MVRELSILPNLSLQPISTVYNLKVLGGAIFMQYQKPEIKEKIISAAMQEFLENGFEKSSLRTIAKGAGMTVGNIYRYYENKEALFNEIVLPAILSLEELFKMNKEGNLNVMEVADNLILHLPNLLDSYRTPLLILLKGSKGSSVENARELLMEVLKEDIKKHIEVYNREADHIKLNPSLAKPLAVGFLEGIYDIIHSYDSTEEIQKLTIEYIHFFFYWSIK